MRRSALVAGVFAALLAASTARADDPPATPPPPAPPPNPVQSVAPEEATAILGQRVIDAEGTDVGRLVDVLVGANGQPEAGVIDFGGFMGVGNRKVAVHWTALHFSPADALHKVTLEMTPDQIKAAPEFRNPNKAAAVVLPAEPAAPPVVPPVAPPVAAPVAAPAAPPEAPPAATSP